MAQKILHILTGLARGGCEGNAMCMIRQTPECEHHLLVLGTAGDMSADFASACSIVQYCQPLKWPWSLSRQVRAHVANLAPAGVIVWHGMVMLPQILHALEGFQIPVLVHGGNPAYGLPPAVDRRYCLMERWLGRRASAAYVCCTSYVAESFKGSRYLRSFPTFIVPNGVREPDVPLHTPRKLALDGSVTLGMVARLDAIKDHATLIYALPLVLKAWPHAVLELVGDGICRESLQALAASLGLSEKVRFLGTVTDVYAVMSRWDLFVYATTESEGLGNALAEAMMLGLPCVATDIGPIAEVAGQPPSVLLVKPRDPVAMAAGVLNLAGDPGGLTNLAARARERALQEFSGSVFARRYRELLFPSNPS